MIKAPLPYPSPVKGEGNHAARFTKKQKQL